MNPDVYWDLKEMFQRALRMYVMAPSEPQAEAWHTFKEEILEFGNDIWNRYHVLRNPGIAYIDDDLKLHCSECFKTCSDEMRVTKRPVVQWHLTEEERGRIANGEDVYLFYFPENERYSLEIAPEGTGTDETVSLLVEEPAPSGVYVRERKK